MEKNEEISPRQAQILAAIVKEHSETGCPISSKELVDKGYFNVSGPTIRNDMQALEHLGYIMQPHTSAGRVPTDKGFRYFVNQLMDRVKLTLKEQDKLKTELMKLQMANAEVSRRLAKLVSEYSGAGSFALFPEEVSTVGISNLLANPALLAEDAKEIAQFFDNIDEYADKMIAEYEGKGPKAVIGKEIQLSKKSDYSMIVSGLSLPNGKKGVIGLIGPKSMKYEKNLSLMEYIAKWVGGGAGLMLIFLVVR